MADTFVHATVRIPSLDHVPANDRINTFAFSSGTHGPAAMATRIVDLLTDFYNVNHDNHALCYWINETVDRGTDECEITMVDVTGTLNGVGIPSPFAMDTFTLGPSQEGNPLPDECCVCCSFHGSLTGLLEHSGGTSPKSRRRGRIFLGPLVQAAVGDSGPTDADVTVSLIEDSNAAMEDLMTSSSAEFLAWCVWSRAAAAMFPVVGGWTDNEFDTLRKRGLRVSAKTTWS